MAGVFVEGVELQREGDRQVVAQGGAAAQVGGLVLKFGSSSKMEPLL